jgi:hypothetical protein
MKTFSQELENKQTFNQKELNEINSKIVEISDVDSNLVKIILKNGLNDAERNYLPYYLESKITDYNQIATPSIVIKKTKRVPENVKKVLLKYYSKFLGSDFEFIPKSSLCKNENLNRHLLIPFRVYNQNEIEELIDYEVTWKVDYASTLTGQKTNSNFATSSVLSSGDWYKIGVTETGIYKITKDFLSNIGINVNGINPKNIHIYGNGGKMLPERNKDFRYDDLEENAIKVVGEEDGKFDNLDFVLFYATGPDNWIKNKTKGLKFKVVKNLYSDTSFYFIHVNSINGKRLSKISSLNQLSSYSTSNYDYYNFHEENIINFGKSGRDFYGELFDYTKGYQFKWKDDNFIVNDSILCDVSMVAISADTSNFSVKGNGLNLVVTTGSTNFGQAYEDYAKPGYKFGFGINNNAKEIIIDIAKETNKSIGYLDKITFNVRRALIISPNQFCFRESRNFGLGKTNEYRISNTNNSDFVLWDVTDFINPKEQLYNLIGNEIKFVSNADSIREYCIASANNYYVPSFVAKIANQNLHAIQQADYLIITHPIFLNQAEQLGAFHKQKEGYSYKVVTIDQIYNEFSSGRQDISAIRDFIRMIYSRNFNTTKALKYVLLVGDGSYINKNRNIISNTNFIPTYQSIISLSETQSIATDDFYGLMDPDEGQNAENFGSLDIALGRLICKTNDELKAILNKIFNYYKTDSNFEINPQQSTYKNNETTMSDWRNNLLFLADDEDGADHMEDANSLTSLVTNLDQNYNIDKVFLDAYQRFSTAGGARYPDASQDFIKRIEKGVLIFNYTGHGGEVGLTAERIIDVDIINRLNNFNKLPLFITATCEFSRYDDPARTSAGELCLLNAKGGAIALFTTSRLAYSGPNFTLNSILLSNTFKKSPNGARPSIGDIVQMTKSDPRISQSYVYANFHLLGDPAMPLAYPKEKVYTYSINRNVVTNLSSDTLSALTKVTVNGYVGDGLGNKLSSFNGLVYPTVFDKEQNVICLLNTEKSAINYPLSPTSTVGLIPFSFKLQKNILYKGKSQVTNGDFSFTFIVPKDIGFSYGLGRISYYATNGLIDANGFHNKLIVGGISNSGLTDNEGPQINLYLNDKSFVSGGLTNEKPVLFAELTDSSGINTVGTGLGHDISVVLDEKSNNPIVLNDYYEANLNSYQSGKVRYPFSDLSEGQHNLAFKVWDIQNNSNTVYTDFIVAKSSELALKQVMNYPNPFTTHTEFIFQHNQTCVPLKVTVQIYTVSGKNIKTIQQTVSCDNGKTEAVEWDGKDDYNQRIGRGVYIYKLSIINPENKKAEKIEKLVILN